ncbi:FAD binding domain-containing protein [Azospirillum endophyticum]
MKPAPFTYLRPGTIEEALEALATHADADAKLLAGGQSLVPMMNFRMAQPAILIDINRIPGLDRIDEADGLLRIGAMTRHADVKASPLVARHAPLIAEAYEHVAHATVRNRGTLGGNLCHADPASEMPAVMLALEAELVIRRVGGVRTVPAEGFFISNFTTIVEPDEILTEIRVPVRPDGEGCAFEEVSMRKGDFALTAVAARIRMAGDRCTFARLVFCGVEDRPIRVETAEQSLLGTAMSGPDIAQAADIAATALNPIATSFADGEYRRQLARELSIRALSRARKGAAS